MPQFLENLNQLKPKHIQIFMSAMENIEIKNSHTIINSIGNPNNDSIHSFMDDLNKLKLKQFQVFITSLGKMTPSSLKIFIDEIIKTEHKSTYSFIEGNNENIIKTVENILNGRTESEDQINIYDKSGFDGLKKYLVDTVEYNKIKG